MVNLTIVIVVSLGLLLIAAQDSKAKKQIK